MRAVIQHTYGGTERLLLSEVEAPTPGPNDVLLRVRAAGVDQGTWHLMTGRPYVMRLGFGLRGPKHPVPGRDVAGVVEAVGSEVDSVAVGEEVIGTVDGSFADFALAASNRLARKPTGLSFEEAAVLSVSGVSALQAVRQADVATGDHVLVIGASGGVGSYAVQIATAFGARVTGVASAAKADVVRSAGAVTVIDYARQDITEDGTRYDAIIDLAGRRPLRRLRRCLRPGGTLVIVGGEGGDRWLGGTHRQLAAMALSPFVQHRLRAFMSAHDDADLAELVGLVDAGRVRPHLDRAFPLEQAAAAIDHVHAGRARGKVALSVSTRAHAPGPTPTRASRTPSPALAGRSLS